MADSLRYNVKLYLLIRKSDIISYLFTMEAAIADNMKMQLYSNSTSNCENRFLS